MSVYIISEIGVNHNGSLATACQLIDAAKQCGADAVKFQTYVTDDICRKDNPEYTTLKRCELSYDDFRYLFKYATAKGIDFISTPDTVKDAEFLDTLGMRYMKIGSGGHHIIKEWTAQTPLIVSLGMGQQLRSFRLDWVFMHCVSSYPCPLDQANMAAVGNNLEAPMNITGFSDHTIGNLCAIMAVARGAKFIEKHFTLSNDWPGPDQAMSAEPWAFTAYVQAIRQAEQALGDGVRRVMPCEQKTIEQLKARK